MAEGMSVGAIYAEAQLDLSGFETAAAALASEAAGIASSMGAAGQGMDAAQLSALGLAQGLGGLDAAMAGAAATMASGLSDLGPAMQAAAAAAIQSLAAGLDPAPLQASGLGLVQALAAGFGSYDLAGTGGAASSALLSGLSSGAGQATSIGRSFSSGLAAGIQAGRSGVVNAARAVALAAAQAARSALDIHSPSKLTRGYGESFDMGFVRGLERGMPEVDRAVERVLYAPPPSPAAQSATPVSARQAAPAAIDYRRLADALRQVAPVLSLDGRTVARINAENTAVAQNGRARDLALRYGSR